jgi:hypothetical protein
MTTKKTARLPRAARTFALAVACAALGLTGLSPWAAADSPPDGTAVKNAYKDFINAFRTLEKQFRQSETIEIDEAHRVGAYDLITGFLNSGGRTGISTSGTGRRGYPRFAGFDDPDTRIGVDNPDTQYMGTVVYNGSGDQIYRVFGNRGVGASKTVDFILTLFDTASGTGGLGTLEDEDMVIAPDGSYEAYFSSAALKDPAWDNWVELPALDGIQIARRQTACDWSEEVPGEVHIERLGTEGVPSADPSVDVLVQQYQDATALVQTQGPFWPGFVDTIKNNIPVNTATPWAPTGGLGITTQQNMLMWFDLDDDDALILRLPDEDVAKYYGLQISNFWGSSSDWANRHVSMSWGLDGQCQAEQSQPTFHPAQQLIFANGGPFCGAQDAYFVVLSKQDPGVQNWIETAGLTQGIVAGRLQSVDPADVPDVVGLGSCMLPVAIEVPVVAVKPTLQGLGASFGPFAPADRAAQLEERQSFVRNKYVFW